MAAQVLVCQNDLCGREFTALRSDRKWCSDGCRKATTRAQIAATWPPAHEGLVLEEIAAGRLSPEAGILWTLFPDRMRRGVAARVAA